MLKRNFVNTIIIVIFAYAMSMSSCAKISEEELLEDFIYCTDDTVSFQNNILPMITNDCVSCHSGPNAEEGIVLDNYTDIEIYATSGDLMKVITHSSGFAPMPLGKKKWVDCKINTLQKWIDEGAKNN